MTPGLTVWVANHVDGRIPRSIHRLRAAATMSNEIRPPPDGFRCASTTEAVRVADWMNRGGERKNLSIVIELVNTQPFISHDRSVGDHADFLFFLSSSTSVNSASTTSSGLAPPPGAPPGPPGPPGAAPSVCLYTASPNFIEA